MIGVARVAHLLWPLVLVFTGVVLFPSSGRDDVHIAFWSAWGLIEHGAILNYSGDALEQGSSLLHILILALLGKLTGVDLATIATPLSVLFGILAAIEAGRLAARLGADRHWAVAFAATSTPLVYWSFGALETTLVAYLLTAFARSVSDAIDARQAADVRSLAPAMIWGTLYVLARPEAIFVATAFLAFVVFATAVLRRDRAPLERAGSLWIWLLLIFAMLAAWRHGTFGAWFPQPVSAKVDASIDTKVSAAVWYFTRSLRQAPVIFLLLAISAVAALREIYLRGTSNRVVWVVAGVVLAQLSFAAASGGDWMEAARFFVPVVPAICALTAWALATLLPSRLLSPVCALLVLGGLVHLQHFAGRHSTGIPLFEYKHFLAWSREQNVDTHRFSFFELANRVHLRDALFLPHLEAAVDDLLARQDSVTVMSSQGGMVPYHLVRSRFGRVKFLDMGGLTSRDFADCPVLAKNQMRRGAGGIGVSDEFYLAHAEEFEAECAIPIPDVYYNIDRQNGIVSRELEDSGKFTVRYRQQTAVCAPGLRCPPTFTGDMVLAVRRSAVPETATRGFAP